MKKIIEVLFIIIFAILLSGTVAYALITDLGYGTTSRGVPVKMDWSGSAAWRR